MNYVLDTCLVSELIKKEPEMLVVEWVRQQPEERLYLSVLTPGELQKGIAKLKDQQRAKKLQTWLDDNLLESLPAVSSTSRLRWRVSGAKSRGRPKGWVGQCRWSTALSLRQP